MNIVAIIPARIGSKRIPKKNLEKVGDKTLVQHALHAAVKCLHINRIILYVDSLELVPKPFTRFDTMEDFIGRPPGKRVFVIEDKFASDEMKLDANLRTMIDYLLPYDYVVLLQPTSPLRTSGDVTCALADIVYHNTDSLLSGYYTKHFDWGSTYEIPYDAKNRPTSQELELRFIENGAIYIFKPAVLRDENTRIGGGVSMHPMPKSRSFEIDELEDLELVRAIYEYQHRK